MLNNTSLTKQQLDQADTKDNVVQEETKVLYEPLSLPFKHSVVDGWIYPPFIKEATIEATKQFLLRESDVFVATYPKCGTTWTQVSVAPPQSYYILSPPQNYLCIIRI